MAQRKIMTKGGLRSTYRKIKSRSMTDLTQLFAEGTKHIAARTGRTAEKDEKEKHKKRKDSKEKGKLRDVCESSCPERNENEECSNRDEEMFAKDFSCSNLKVYADFFVEEVQEDCSPCERDSPSEEATDDVSDSCGGGSSEVMCDENDCPDVPEEGEPGGLSLLNTPSGSTDILEVNSASMESLDDGGNEEPPIDYIDADPELKLLDKEPELWVHTVDKEVVAGLSEKQIKKQEHIYELIITEKHHCRMLKVMQKVFADGMARELHMQENRIKRIFPCLDDLINIHCSFLWRLRQRQRTGKYIDKIGDLLVEQFVGDNAQGLKDAYGQFCSQHQDAVSYYKDILKTDRRFQAFIRQKSLHPLMKKKGIPECILFVTHRVTKYPLILEALMKYSKDQEEELISLKHALDLVKEILVNINAQVAEKDREQRLLEVYHKIDAKSSAVYREQKFKKSDLLSSRKLKFEGSAMLTQQKGKPIMVQVIVLSDLIFFLLENNQKYYFFSPDTKQADVIPLEKLIVREKAGEGSRAIYLIYSKNAAEMFELECIHPKDKKIWLESIREAIDQCPEEDNTGEASGEISKLLEANSEKIRHITGILQHKDKELARLCEDKMNLVIELLELLGHDDFPPTPQYRALLDEHQLDYNTARDLQINSLNEALRLVSGACGWGTNLARSVSSVGEHQSDAYVSPSLPKRAETFGGFDNPNKDASGHASKQSGGKKKKDSRLSLTSTGTTDSDVMESLKNRRPSGSTLAVRSSQDNLSIGSTMSDSVTQQQQQALAAKLIYWLQTSLVLSQHHLTQYDILRTKMVVGGSSVDGRFRHSQKLEELRNIQEQISHERAQWNKERDAQEKWISEKKLELQKKQEDLRMNEQDITQQRELLYRKLEALKAQGIILSPTLTVLTTAPPSHSVHDEHHIGNVIAGAGDGGQSSQGSPHSSPPSAAPARMRTDPKHRNSTAGVASLIKRDSNQSLPTHLISAANQQKAAISVKQQLPMKLAKLGSSSSTGSSSGSGGGGASSPSQDRIEHHRTHVSPGASGVVQMLPLKLSQGPDEKKGSRMTVGYQRLASPPPSLHEPPPGPSHQRTGSSPATLQNGSPITSPGASTPTATTTAQGAHATRTNTYPKLPSKPSVPTPRATTTPEALQEGSGVGSAARPGHRIKDPVTNQDIIFF